ncbi:MAG: hypothetical protein JF612_10220, partial [Planctomycetia bacterium]|nr:hypothetical protein [Planctomycetia bacterium]
MSLSPALRRVAVLVSALDAEAADAILAQIGAEDAAKVRNALVELHDISTEEQQQVLTAFLRAQAAANMQPAATVETVTLELDPAIEAAMAAENTRTTQQPAEQPTASASFAFLEEVDPKSLAAVLTHEMPQTVAMVVAHLPPEQAAAVLQ